MPAPTWSGGYQWGNETYEFECEAFGDQIIISEPSGTDNLEIIRMGVFCETMLSIPDLVAVVGDVPVIYQIPTQNSCESLTLSL